MTSALVIVALTLGLFGIWSCFQTMRVPRPRGLVRARLALVEKMVRSTGLVRVTARIDRAYRLPTGHVVLMELKFRKHPGVLPTDIVQLSVQKIALESQTGARVASYAFVAVRRPAVWGRWRLFRVQLMDAGKVAALMDRREAILAGEIASVRTVDPRLRALSI